MIEINLLPPEYRPREKTNLPVLASMAVGLLLAGSMGMIAFRLSGEVSNLESQKKELEVTKADLQAKAAEVDKLTLEIARQKSRQDTIINISQSKVMWSLKLAQFAEIMSSFPGFWIDSLTLTKSGAAGGKGGLLTMSVSCTGNDFREIARFRDAMKTDPNFFYHFADLESQDVRIEDLRGAYVNATDKMVFQVRLPLSTEAKQ
jgi:Tfp pilus assembly protein PilN